MTKGIIEKLQLQKYERRAVLSEDRSLQGELKPLAPYDTKLQNGPYDLIFSYVTDLPEMKAICEKVAKENFLAEKGYLFIAYPKRGNKAFETSIHRDEIFPYLQVNEDDGYLPGSDLKFSRMVQLDEVFTVVGLKMDRSGKGKVSSASSQRVADYEARIPEIEALLVPHPIELALYESLTPGYRRDWARYIFSAKQEATRTKRAAEMVEVLGKGYKTMELYKKSKRT